eukprot:6035018-Amphidinium_carterae.5
MDASYFSAAHRRREVSSKSQSGDGVPGVPSGSREATAAEPAVRGYGGSACEEACMAWLESRRAIVIITDNQDKGADSQTWTRQANGRKNKELTQSVPKHVTYVDLCASSGPKHAWPHSHGRASPSLLADKNSILTYVFTHKAQGESS